MICEPERMPPLPSPSEELTPSRYSLDALSSYIQSQRDLLSRTQSEIERLHALKKEVKDEEDLTVGDIDQKVRFTVNFGGKSSFDLPVAPRRCLWAG